MFLTRLADEIRDYFSDEENPEEPAYDPRHVAAMIVIVLVAMTVLFWLLWALLVFGGGIQAKVWPLLQVIFTARTAVDFGYVGYPYAMGVFDGWVTNVVALALLIGLVAGIIYVFNAKTKEGKRELQ